MKMLCRADYGSNYKRNKSDNTTLSLSAVLDPDSVLEEVWIEFEIK